VAQQSGDRVEIHDLAKARWRRLGLFGNLSKNQKATLRTVVAGPGTLTFWCKEDTANWDGDLEFRIDGVYNTGAFNDDWMQKTIAIADGMHTLEWVYSVDTTSLDYAAVDQVVYTPANLTLAEALDAPEINWTSWGNNNAWSGVLMENAFGMDCARSGAIADGYNTFLEGTVKGPALLTFNWKVSSQPRSSDYFAHDDLEFYLDDKQVDEINGETGWQTKQYLLPKGEHKLNWDYYKDPAISAGQDCGWVDRVRVAALPSLNEALDNSTLVYWCEGSADWIGQPLLYYYGGSAAKSGAVVTGQKSTLVTSITGPARVGWFWKISASSMNRLELWIDGKYQISVAGSVDWKAESYYIQPGKHTVEWRYNKISVFPDGQDCGWIDRMTLTSVPKANIDRSWALYR
jgi:hypothetical protein